MIAVFGSFVLELNQIPWALVAVEPILIVGILSLAVACEEWTQGDCNG
jgi:hypothetical protein